MSAHKPIVGTRIIKTCVSVFLIYLISELSGYPTAPINAYIAGVMGMKDSVENSLDYGIKRTASTLIGGVAALAALQLLTLVPAAGGGIARALIYPLGVGLILMVSSRYGLGDLSALGATIYLIALIGYSDTDIFLYIFVRTLETVAGIGISVLVNRYFMPKRSRAERHTAQDSDDTPL